MQALSIDPKMVAVPLLLPDIYHFVAVIITPAPDKKYQMVTFDPMGNEINSHVFKPYEESVIELLGAENVVRKPSRTALQKEGGPDHSCGAYTVDFMSYAIANPELVAQNNFSPQSFTDLMPQNQLQTAALRKAHISLLDSPEKRGMFLTDKVIRNAPVPNHIACAPQIAPL